ncbi:MAG: EpsG family protein [Bacteroidales bacterium]|jgi:hypothetical protein|nr:EpsG family protein [Bacteroidales bacterium]
MKKKNIDYFIFTISPILSLPYYIKGIKEHRKTAFYSIGAFFSLLGAYLPPTNDAYRYRELYYSNMNVDWNTLFIENKDFLFIYLSKIFNNLGVEFELFKFFILLVSYSLYIWMFLDILKTNPHICQNNKLYIWSCTALFFSIRLFTIAYGIRFGVASSIVIVSVYLLHKQKIIAAIIVLLCAIFMHFSISVILLLVLLSYFLVKVKLNMTYKILILLILCIFANSSISSILLYIFPDNILIQQQINIYIDGNWGTNSMLESMNFNGYMFTIIRIIPIFPLSYFVLKKTDSSFLSNMGFLLMALLCISTSSITLLLRYSNIGIAICFISFLCTMKNNKTDLKRMKITVFSFLIVFCSYVYAHRKEFVYGYQNIVLCCPIITIPNHLYTDEWVYKYIDSEGYFR